MIFIFIMLITKFTINYKLPMITKNLKRIFYQFHQSQTKFNLDKNYYEILGLSKKSNIKDIKNAYYKLAKMYHPDINKDH